MPHRVTQREVAAEANVSNATVSYVLSGRRDRSRPVSDETRERVLAAVVRTGYRMNHVARSLRRRRTDVVCVLYPTPASPSVEETVNLFVPAAAKRGLTTVCLPIVDDAIGDALQFLSGGSADAVLLLRDHRLSATQLHELAENMAVVAFEDRARARGFDVVRTHRERAQAMVIDRLAATGRKRIALFLHYPSELDTTGYLDALRRNGLAEGPIRFVATDRSAAHQAALDLLAAKRRPQAIVTASDRSAVQAIYAAQELGLRVPDDVAVIGSGDIEEGIAARPALTTIGHRRSDLLVVMDRLFERLAADEPLPGKSLNVPWRLVPRDSG
jgi:DNA-binding LacI/PurR family transcriptional regulator